MAFADSKANRWLGPGASEAARVGGIVTLPLFLFKKRSEYMSIQFRDPETDAEGVTSFKMDTDELTSSMVYALAQKAGLVHAAKTSSIAKEGGYEPTPADKVAPVNIPLCLDCETASSRLHEREAPRLLSSWRFLRLTQAAVARSFTTIRDYSAAVADPRTPPQRLAYSTLTSASTNR